LEFDVKIGIHNIFKVSLKKKIKKVIFIILGIYCPLFALISVKAILKRYYVGVVIAIIPVFFVLLSILYVVNLK